MTSLRSAGAWLAVIAATALAVSGCSAPGPGPAADGEPVDGGTITVAIDGDPSSQLDIHVTAADISALVLRNAFDSLVVQDVDGSFGPWLAESWDVSDDGLAYTFDLKDGVTFHDGEVFDAEAVKANFDHISNPETASQYAAARLGGDTYARTEVVDNDTFIVHFTEPYAAFLQAASTPYLGFYSPAVLADSADKLIAGGPGVTVGTGPFVLDGIVAGQELSFTKNPDYNWAPENATHTGAARADALVFRILPENAVRAGALSSGDVDVATNLSPNDVPGFEADGTITLTSAAAPGLPYSIFLNHSTGVFQDKLVRQAFQRGIDITSAVGAVYGGEYERAWSVLSPTTPNAYDPSVEGTWEFDPKLAGSLLDQAGWTEKDAEGYRTKDGVRLSAGWPTFSAPREDRKSLTDAFQADLKKIGFELVPQPMDGGAYMESLYGGTYDIVDWSFVRPDGDILRLHLFSEFAPIQNASFVNDAALDELLVTASESTDPAERERIYSDVQHGVIDDAAIVPVYVPSQIVGVSPHIGGVRSDIIGWPLFYDAWTSK